MDIGRLLMFEKLVFNWGSEGHYFSILFHPFFELSRTSCASSRQNSKGKTCIRFYIESSVGITVHVLDTHSSLTTHVVSIFINKCSGFSDSSSRLEKFVLLPRLP
jgi:hypothetical protein